MKQFNFIKTAEIGEIKKQVETLYSLQKPIEIVIKKTRTKMEEHLVSIAGVYAKFFTVKDDKLNLSFTVQYVDVAMGNVCLLQAEEKEDL